MLRSIPLFIATLTLTLSAQQSVADDRISGLRDVRFVSDNAADNDYLITLPFCVELDSGTDYELEIHSTASKGKNYLLIGVNDASNDVNVEYRLNDHPSNEGDKIETNDTFSGQGASNQPYCADTGNNANLNIRIKEKDLEKVVADTYHANITIDLLNSQNGSLLDQQSITVEMVRQTDFLVGSLGDIYLLNTTNKQVFQNFCIGLVASDDRRDQRYRITVQGQYPSDDQQFWQLKNAFGDLISYELKWIEKGRSKNPKLSPSVTTGNFKIRQDVARDNYSSLRRSGSCTHVDEGFEFTLQQTATSSGAYSDTLTVTVSAE